MAEVRCADAGGGVPETVSVNAADESAADALEKPVRGDEDLVGSAEEPTQGEGEPSRSESKPRQTGYYDNETPFRGNLTWLDRIKAFFVTSGIIFLILDEEVVMLGIFFIWLKKQVDRSIRAVKQLAPSVGACGAAAGGVAYLASPLYNVEWASRGFRQEVPAVLSSGPLGGVVEYLTRWHHHDATAVRRAQQEWVLGGYHRVNFSSPGMILSPLPWGLRFMIHNSVMQRFRRGTLEGEVPFSSRLACGFLSGAWSEFWARMLTAPFTKSLSEATRRKVPFTEAMRILWKEGGTMRLWSGAASLAVEVPHMGVVLGAYTTLRDDLSTLLGLSWPEGGPGIGGLLMRVPLDAVCGGVATALGFACSHYFRREVEIRRRDTAFLTYHTRRTNSLRPTFAHRSSSFLPLNMVLASRVPHAMVLFPAFSLLMGVVHPNVREGGFAGWGDTPRVASRYGSYKVVVDSMENDFFSTFGMIKNPSPNYAPFDAKNRNSS